MKRLLFALSAFVIASCGGEAPADEAGPASPNVQGDTLRVAFTIGEELGDSTNTFGILNYADYHIPRGTSWCWTQACHV